MDLSRTHIQYQGGEWSLHRNLFKELKKHDITKGKHLPLLLWWRAYPYNSSNWLNYIQNTNLVTDRVSVTKYVQSKITTIENFPYDFTCGKSLCEFIF